MFHRITEPIPLHEVGSNGGSNVGSNNGVNSRHVPSIFYKRPKIVVPYIYQNGLSLRFLKHTGTIHTFYRFRSTFAFVIGSTISSSKIISSTQNRVYSIYIYNM